MEEYPAEALWFDLPIACIDVETTGRDAAIDRVVEIGIVVGQAGKILRRAQWLVHPGCSIPKEVQAIHGISDEDVREASPFAALTEEIRVVLAQNVPAAYNAPFDRAFLEHEFRRAPQTEAPSALSALRTEVVWIDPLVWARELQREERSKTLKEVTARLGITLTDAHRAAHDAEATLRVLYAFALDTRVPRTYGAFVQEQKRLAQEQASARRYWRT